MSDGRVTDIPVYAPARFCSVPAYLPFPSNARASPIRRGTQAPTSALPPKNQRKLAVKKSDSDASFSAPSALLPAGFQPGALAWRRQKRIRHFQLAQGRSRITES